MPVARARLNKKVYDDAIDDYSEFIRLKAGNADAYADRGICFSAKRDYARASADFTEAIRYDPKNVTYRVYRGNSFMALHDYRRAIDDFSLVLARDPKNVDAYLGRAGAYIKTDQAAKAAADFDAAWNIDPRNFTSLNNPAWYLATSANDGLRDETRALELATRACELSDWKAVYPLDTLAACHAACGNFNEAVRWQLKAIRLNEDNALANDLARRLDLYVRGKAYREH